MQQLKQLANSAYNRRMNLLIRTLERHFPALEQRMEFLEVLDYAIKSPDSEKSYSKVIQRLIWYYEYLSEHGPQTPYTMQEMFLYDELEFYWYRDFTLVLHRRRLPVWDKDLNMVTGYEPGNVTRIRLFTHKYFDPEHVEMVYLN